MDLLSKQDPQVTIVVVPRERFSCTQASLESLYEHTDYPFKLLYVDGNSPRKVRRYLEQQAKERSFQVVRTDHYLSPNHARNIGLTHVDTKYIVFCDNDVIFTPGWLEALVTCAAETEASVVGPLMCEKEPVHTRIHFAGGESRVVTDIHGRRRIREKMYTILILDFEFTFILGWRHENCFPRLAVSSAIGSLHSQPNYRSDRSRP